MGLVEREAVLPAPPGRVWEALSDPEQLSAWFGADAAIEVRPGGRARFRWADGTERIAVVETAEAPRLLVFRWLPFERTGQGAARLAGTGRVRIELEPRDGGTLLTVMESGLPAGADDPPSAGADDPRPTGAPVTDPVSLERSPPAPPGPVIRAGAR